MKLYIVTREPFPNGMAATKRIRCYAKASVMAGMECEIVVFHRGEVYGTPPKNTIGEGDLDGYHFRYIGGTPLRASNVFRRQYDDFIDKVNTVRYLDRHLNEGDVVMLYLGEERHLSQRIVKTAHAHRCMVVRDLCEYPYATKEETNANRRRLNSYLKNILPKFDGTICISEPLLQLAQMTCPNSIHIKVPILVEAQDSSEVHHHVRPYIFHGGTMYERKDAIVSTMKAFGMACIALDKRIDFILAGPASPHQAELDAIITQYDMRQNVTFLPLLPHTEISAYQNGAFAIVLNKNDNTQNRYGFSTKLGEVLMSGTPLITTTVGEANNWLKDGISAYIVAPHDPQLIASKIIEVFQHPEESKIIAQRGKEIAQKYFSLEYQGNKMADYFKMLNKSKGYSTR